MRQFDLLNMDTLQSSNLIDEGDHYVIEVDGQGIPGRCPHCQAEGPYRHGTQQQHYIDTPMHGKPVLLRVDRARFRCKSCGKTFSRTCQTSTRNGKPPPDSSNTLSRSR